MRMLVNAGADIEARHGNYTAACLAARATAFKGQVAMEVLAELGANLEVDCGYGKTPLILSVEWSTKRNVQFLINQGVDINARDDEGNTALFYAKDYRLRKIAKLLENNGATL